MQIFSVLLAREWSSMESVYMCSLREIGLKPEIKTGEKKMPAVSGVFMNFWSLHSNVVSISMEDMELRFLVSILHITNLRKMDEHLAIAAPSPFNLLCS